MIKENFQHVNFKDQNSGIPHPEKFDQKMGLIPFYGRAKSYKSSEDNLQKAVTHLIAVKYRDANYFHVANEGIRQQGNHAFRFGAKRKAMGVKSGVSDCQFDNARKGFHGLKIELKVKSVSPKAEQIEYLTRCQNEGYFVAVCWNLESVETILNWYFELEDRK